MASAPGIRPLAAPVSTRRVERHRLVLSDGEETTVHVLRMARAQTRVCVVALPRPQQLLTWCRRERVGDAIIGGFFVRPQGRPLGEVRIDGRALPSQPFESPWAELRSCVQVDSGGVALAPRNELPADPPGDLLQAGPLLCRGARNLIEGAEDPEGFSAGQGDFDSDITRGRYPRAALGIGRDEIIAAVCEGRDTDEAGLTLSEFAGCMIDLGAESAVNLDGGGSTTLIRAGALLNTPREEHGVPLPGGRPVSTALVFLDAPR